MKLLFLNTNIGYGGASKMLVWLANQCAQKGYEVTFITYRDKIVRQQSESRVKLVHKSLEEDNGGGCVFITVKWLHKFIKKNRFDLGVAFLSPSILRLALAAKGTDMKILFSFRGDPYYCSSAIKGIKSLAIYWLNSWAFKQADVYVFQTQMAQAYYHKSIQKRSYVIPNPVCPLERTKERVGNIRKSFVAVGRLDLKQKRQDLLIKAFNLISPKYPDFKLEIYGDGEDEPMVKKMAASNHNILLMGKTSNVAEAIQNAWATVLSSDFEGIPNALLESMSLGVPSISTDCSPGGASMLIRNKENGLLTPRGDAMALAESMEYLITFPAEAEKMGKIATEVNTLFDEDTIASKWFSIIELMK